MSHHPSRVSLERFSVSDLSDEATREVETHELGCDECNGYVAELRAAREARLAAVPLNRFMAQVDARRARARRFDRRRLARIGAGVVALACVAASIVLAVRKPISIDRERMVSLKGTGVTVYRNRGNSVMPLATDDTIRSHDALQVVVTTPHALRVAAWFVDKNGRVDRALPEVAVDAPAGESSLPGSAVVASPCVDLNLVVVSDAVSFEEVENAMRRAVGRSKDLDAVLQDRAWIPKGAVTRRLRCE